MFCEEINYEVRGQLALVTLCRPDKLNAYTPDMGEELVWAFRQAFADEEVKVIILTGEGRGFCAGADREFIQGKLSKRGLPLGQESFIKEFALELAQADKLLIAAVNGVASGIGVTMILPFDIRLASADAYFDFPFVKLGLCPGFGCSYYLPKLIGAGNASDVLLNSRKLNATAALDLGLVNQVLLADELLEQAFSIAGDITAVPQYALAHCKALLAQAPGSSLHTCMQREIAASRKIRELNT